MKNSLRKPRCLVPKFTIFYAHKELHSQIKSQLPSETNSNSDILDLTLSISDIDPFSIHKNPSPIEYLLFVDNARHQTEDATTLGTSGGNKAKKIKAIIRKTGIDKSINGGGGSGGRTNGSTTSDTVNTTKTTIDIRLKYLTIKPSPSRRFSLPLKCRRRSSSWVFLVILHCQQEFSLLTSSQAWWLWVIGETLAEARARDVKKGAVEARKGFEKRRPEVSRARI